MQEIYSHKRLLEEFIEFENKNSLFELEIKNIKIWQFIRLKVFTKLRSNFILGSIENSDRKPKIIINGAREFLINSLLKNPFRINKKYKYIILNHSRRKSNGEVYKDIYTDYFLKNLNHSDYVVLERFNNLSHLKPVETNNLYYLDFIEFPARFISKLPINFQKNKIEKINLLIENKWGVKNIIDNRLIEKTIRYYKFIEPKIERLIKRINPKLIIEVVSYSTMNQIFTQVAKKNNITVIELQHGTVGAYHLAYNFKGKPELKTFPTCFYAWGEFWIKNVRFPISKENVKIIGFPYIDNLKKKSKKTKNNLKRIVVISQLRYDIAEFTLELAKILPEYKIFFKAHPKEYSIAKRIYKSISYLTNVEIINSDNKPLYSFFQECDYTLSVNSTALIEALAFGSSIGIIKLPGWECFEDLQESDKIKFLNNVSEAKLFITQSKNNTSNETEKYFMSDPTNRVIKELGIY